MRWEKEKKGEKEDEGGENGRKREVGKGERKIEKKEKGGLERGRRWEERKRCREKKERGRGENSEQGITKNVRKGGGGGR